MPSRLSWSTSLLTRSIALPKGCAERICEPMWTLTPCASSQRFACRALVDAQGLADVDAELVLAQAGGDVGMRVGEDVGIDAQGKARDAFQLAGASGKQREFGFALHVEFEDAGVESEIDLRGGLAHAGEDNAAGSFRRGGEDALAAPHRRRCRSPRHERPTA